MLRRRRLPLDLDGPFRAFAATAARLERAKEDLLLAIPGARVLGRPLADALLAFREGLDEADETMPGWHVPDLAAEWGRCRDGIAAARRDEERVRLHGASFAHDVLLFTLQDLIAHLEPFADAARAFEARRRRRSPGG